MTCLSFDLERVVDLYRQLDVAGVLVWIDGGWGVDALLEEITREHADLDIIVQEKDLNQLEDVLRKNDYQRSPEARNDTRPWNFVLKHFLGYEVDVHVVVLDAEGNGIYGPKEQGVFYPREALLGKGRIDNVSVRCVAAKYQLESHSGYLLKEKDFCDIFRLCKRFSLTVPEEVLMKRIGQLQKIETSRLIIRPVELSDSQPLHQAVVNSVDHLRKWQVWAKDPSFKAIDHYVRQGVAAWKSGHAVDFPMVVIHKEDNKLIGASGYNDRSVPKEGCYEVGYWCDVDYQGQGLVTEYANALTRYAFEALCASKVIIRMQTDNVKSMAVAERLNFERESVVSRDILDCVSGKAEKDYIYSIGNINQLPVLAFLWDHVIC